MRRSIVCASIVVLLGVALAAARAANVDLNKWFSDATQYNASGNGVQIAKPDFLGGSMRTNCQWVSNEKLPPLGNGIWQLKRYDHTHHIGLAVATTDQCSGSVFKAPTPSVAVPDADLSNYSTGRGLKIGSPYAKVLSLYGPPAEHGRHFAAIYTADVPDISMANKPVKLPETITIVIDNGSVSAITISVDEGGLF